VGTRLHPCHRAGSTRQDRYPDLERERGYIVHRSNWPPTRTPCCSPLAGPRRDARGDQPLRCIRIGTLRVEDALSLSLWQRACGRVWATAQRHAERQRALFLSPARAVVLGSCFAVYPLANASGRATGIIVPAIHFVHDLTSDSHERRGQQASLMFRANPNIRPERILSGDSLQCVLANYQRTFWGGWTKRIANSAGKKAHDSVRCGGISPSDYLAHAFKAYGLAVACRVRGWQSAGADMMTVWLQPFNVNVYATAP